MRPLKFVKYLPTFKINPIVLSPQNAAWKAYDYSNLKLPFLKDTPIYRCGIQRLQNYYNLRYKKGIRRHPLYYIMAIKYFCFLDFFSAWYFECRQKAVEIVLKEKVDCVLTTSPPHSTHLFGLYLKKTLNVPWVMDIRDAMTVDPNRRTVALMGLQKTLENLYEKKFYAKADAIITVSDPITESIKKRHSDLQLESKTYTITNGFDNEDFLNIKKENNIRRHFTVTYTGSFMGKQTPEYFLKAVQLVIKTKAVQASDIKIRFVGHFDESVRALFNQFASMVSIEVLEFKPYSEALWHQVNSDILLLIVNIEEHEGGTQTMTGKFFEYLGAAKPILALVPEGPLKKVIKQGQFGIATPPKDIQAIASSFKTLYDQWKEHGNIKFAPDMQLRATFSRKRLTAKLAQIIDQLK